MFLLTERVNPGAIKDALSEDAFVNLSYLDDGQGASSLQFQDSVYKHLASGDRMVMPLTSSPWLVERLPVVGGQPGGARGGS